MEEPSHALKRQSIGQIVATIALLLAIVGVFSYGGCAVRLAAAP